MDGRALRHMPDPCQGLQPVNAKVVIAFQALRAPRNVTIAAPIVPFGKSSSWMTWVASARVRSVRPQAGRGAG